MRMKTPKKITAGLILVLLWAVLAITSLIGYSNAMLSGLVAVITFFIPLILEIMSKNAFKFSDNAIIMYGIVTIALATLLGAIATLGSNIALAGFSFGWLFPIPFIVGLLGYSAVSVIAGMISKK